MKSKILLFFCLLVSVPAFAGPAASAKPEAIKQEEAKFNAPKMIAIPGKNYEMGKYEVPRRNGKR